MNDISIEDPSQVKMTDITTKSVDEELADPKQFIKQQHAAKRTRPFIVLAAVCAALGGLIFGYDIAGAGGTFLMHGFEEHFGWTCPKGDTLCVPATEDEKDRDKGLINGLFGFGAIVGAISGPWLADNYGRRACLSAASTVFIFGASLQAAAPTMRVMWTGRVFAGIGIGTLSMSVPVYIGELAPEHVRGQLNTLWQLAITFGILIASAANLGLQHWDQGWRISYGGNIVFAVLLFFSVIFMPESPRWLVGKDREADARAVLERVRYADEVDDDLKEITLECKEEKERGVAAWSEVIDDDNTMRYRLILGVALQTAQQLCGINAIMFYAPTVLNEFFDKNDAIIGTFALNTINFLATFITIYAVEKFGRVKLLVSGGIVMTLSLIANAILSSRNATITIGYFVLVFSAIFIVGFAYSWGPVVWVVCAELYPLRARAKATGITTMTNWLWTTIVGAVFPKASSASLSGCFGFFAVVIFCGTIVVYLYEAETSKKTILEVDKAFAEHKPALIRKKF